MKLCSGIKIQFTVHDSQLLLLCTIPLFHCYYQSYRKFFLNFAELSVNWYLNWKLRKEVLEISRPLSLTGRQSWKTKSLMIENSMGYMWALWKYIRSETTVRRTCWMEKNISTLHWRHSLILLKCYSLCRSVSDINNFVGHWPWIYLVLLYVTIRCLKACMIPSSKENTWLWSGNAT